MAVDRTGNYNGQLYVTTGGSDHIYSVSPAGITTMFCSWPDLTNGGGPVGIEFDLTGNYNGQMYIANSFGSSAPDKSGIFAIDPTCNVNRFASDLLVGRELGFDLTGLFDFNMFAVADDTLDEDFSIWRVMPDGSVAEFARSTDSIIGSLAFGPDGAMYVSELDKTTDLVTVTRVVPEPASIILFSIGAAILRSKKS